MLSWSILLSSPLLSYPLHPILSILSYPLHPILSSPLHPFLSSPSYPLLSSPIISCPVLSYPFLSYHLAKPRPTWWYYWSVFSVSSRIRIAFRSKVCCMTWWKSTHARISALHCSEVLRHFQKIDDFLLDDLHCCIWWYHSDRPHEATISCDMINLILLIAYSPSYLITLLPLYSLSTPLLIQMIEPSIFGLSQYVSMSYLPGMLCSPAAQTMKCSDWWWLLKVRIRVKSPCDYFV